MAYLLLQYFFPCLEQKALETWKLKTNIKDKILFSFPCRSIETSNLTAKWDYSNSTKFSRIQHCLTTTMRYLRSWVLWSNQLGQIALTVLPQAQGLWVPAGLCPSWSWKLGKLRFINFNFIMHLQIKILSSLWEVKTICHLTTSSRDNKISENLKSLFFWSLLFLCKLPLTARVFLKLDHETNF